MRAFGTPTVVHFGAALLISAVMSAPWPSLSNLAACIGVCGAIGLAYSLLLIWHARNASYNPDAEDWMWYTILPIIAYAGLAITPFLLWRRPVLSLFVIGAITLVLLVIGIHNAWDTATYIAVHGAGHEEEK